MTPDELVDLLHQQGLDDDAVKKLLSEALASLEPEDDLVEDDEKGQAEKLLGVDL